jgi:hypothetical protein
MVRKFFCLLILIVSAGSASAQNPTPLPAPISEPTLDVILAEAAKQTAFYREEFKNLLADEKKTFERYNRQGEMRDSDVVESNLLVYQSPKNQNVGSELRNVTKVNGKLIPDSQKRSDEFFGELEKTRTLESELEKIQREGSRYDKTLEINGFTLNEGLVLADNLRPFFEFQLTGRENLNGRDVYVVNFRQTKASPYISINGRGTGGSGEASLNLDGFDLPGALKNSEVLLRGKLWIDAGNFQLWREEREVTVQADAPVVVLETIFDYQPSEYGILVPKQIVWTAYDVKRNSKENRFESVKETRVVFDYSRFRKSNVEVVITDET